MRLAVNLSMDQGRLVRAEHPSYAVVMGFYGPQTPVGFGGIFCMTDAQLAYIMVWGETLVLKLGDTQRIPCLMGVSSMH